MKRAAPKPLSRLARIRRCERVWAAFFAGHITEDEAERLHKVIMSGEQPPEGERWPFKRRRPLGRKGRGADAVP